jgi:phage-related tail protein
VGDVPENGAFSLLEARHVDALTEAVRAATTSQAIANELVKKQTAATEKLTQAVERLAVAIAGASAEVPADVPTVPRTSSRDIR